MADDIDIEEHDILENPRIKDILPHCNIKEEPEDLDIEYEDPAENFEEYNYYEADFDPELEEESYTDHGETAESYRVSPNVSNDIYVHNNKIILGSKPCSRNDSPVILEKGDESFADNFKVFARDHPRPENVVEKAVPIIANVHGSQIFGNPIETDIPSTSRERKVIKTIVLGSKPCPKSKKIIFNDIGENTNEDSFSKIAKPSTKCHKLFIRKETGFASQNPVISEVTTDTESAKKSIVITKKSIIFGTKPCPKSRKPMQSTDQFQDDCKRPMNKPCPKSRKPMFRKPDSPVVTSLSTQSPKSLNYPENSMKPDRVLEKAIVILEDWSVHLERNQCYCDKCQTLFATRNALDAHNMTAHSFLVALSNPKTPESPNQDEISEEPSEDTDRKYCNQCQIYFTDDYLLIQHLYEHLTSKNDGTGFTKLFYKCPICFSYYTSKLRFTKHMNRNHSVIFDNVKAVPFNARCDICKRKYTLILSHNKHIQSAHKDFYVKKMSQEKRKPVHTKIKKNVKTVKKVAKYSQVNNKLTKTCKLSGLLEVVHGKNVNTPKTKQSKVAKYQCVKCKSFYSLLKSAMAHVRLRHSGDPLAHQGKIENVNMFQYYRSLFPVNAIFKCSNCSVHVICPIAVDLHDKLVKCEKPQSKWSLKNFWTCKICDAMFRYRDKHFHEEQHKKCDDINTYTFSDSIYNRILYKCDECNVYFNEKVYLKHHHEGCQEVPSTWCSICKIKIDSDIDHKSDHVGMNKSDFILLDKFFKPSDNVVSGRKNLQLTSPTKLASAKTELISSESLNSSGLKRKLPPLANVSAKVPKKSNKVILYYCEFCYTFSKHLICSKFHAERYCVSQKMRGSTCQYCGLVFRTGTPLIRHRDDHRRFKWKFEDYEFCSLIDKKPIVPSIPVFPTCKECNIEYVSAQHNCNDCKKTCNICNKQFNPLAYRLHQMHHKYLKSSADLKVSELLQKYESLKSTWNIIYQCSDCDLSTDSYDRAVEHAQKHFTSSAIQRVSRSCEICSIKFDDSSIKKHKELHANGDIKKSSFNVLVYNHEHLLSPKWYKLFGNISKAEIEQITSPSIYVTRAVKMTLILNGPPEFTIYKCEACKNYVDGSDILAHSNACDGNRRVTSHPCSFCDIPFNTVDALKKHQEIHKTSNVTTNSYRIVSFNAKSDKDFNMKLQDVKTDTVSDDEDKPRRKFCLFLQCKTCKSSSPSADFFKQHNCLKSQKNDLWSCHKCSFASVSRNKQNHLQWHKENRGLRKKDIYFIRFDKTVPFEHEVRTNLIPMNKTHLWFQCTSCEVLLSSSLMRHVCDTTVLETCTICNYRFSPRSFKFHVQEHGKRVITRDMIQIIPLSRPDNYVMANSDDKTSYKCRCGVKFLSEFTLQKHTEVCSIVRDSNKKFSSCDDPTDLKPRDVCQTSIEMYRCSECLCLFLTMFDFSKHVRKEVCDASKGVNCDKCGLVFHEQAIGVHRISHDSTDYDKTRQRIVTLGKYTRQVLYKCNQCSVHLLDEPSFKRHLKLCKNTVIAGDCKVCGLLFPVRSLNRHFHIQHRTTRILKAEDFFIVCGDPVFKVARKNNGGNVTGEVEASDTFEYEIPIVNEIPIENDTQITPATSKLIKVYEVPIENKRKLMSASFQNCEFDRTIYNCWCGVCFITKNAWVNHNESGHSQSKEWCSICGLVFSQECLKLHIRAHHDIMGLETEDFILVDNDVGKFAFKRKPNDLPGKPTLSNCLYECEVCCLHFLDMQSALMHCSTCSVDVKVDEANCDICGLNFTKTCLFKHKTVHHDGLKYTFEDFKIFVVCKYDAEKDLNLKNPLRLDDGSNVFDSPLSSEEVNIDASVNNLSVEKDTHRETIRLQDHAVDQCEKCDLHFLSNSSLRQHTLGGHEVGEVSKCAFCGLRFPLKAMKRHVASHHGRFKLDNPVIRKMDEPKASSAKNLQDNVLYKCVPCDVHFLSRRAFEFHKIPGKHVTTPQRSNLWLACDVCGLRFTSRCLKKHTQKHHKSCSLTIQDFEIRTGVGKVYRQVANVGETNLSLPAIDATHSPIAEQSVSMPDISDSLNDSTMPNDLDRSEIDKSILTDLNDTKASNSDADTKPLNKSELDKNDKDDTGGDVAAKRTHENSKTSKTQKDKKGTIRLFKCGECNVFFLSQKTCYKHIIYHKVMEPKEYIECKLCSLQFRIMSLGQHIWRHHNSEFELSKVLVEEYQPKKKGEKTPKIDIYYAIDKVQSRLVSTTTNDEKDDRKCSHDASQSRIEPTEIASSKSSDVIKKDSKTNTSTSEKDNNVATSNDANLDGLNVSSNLDVNCTKLDCVSEKDSNISTTHSVVTALASLSKDTPSVIVFDKSINK